MATRHWYDWIFILIFAFFGFVAWFYEPAFIFGCGWEGLGQGLDGPCGESWVGRAWLGYLQVEPAYANAPPYVRISNEADAYLFGPFYAVSLFAFLTNRHTTDWYKGVATFCSGMMVFALLLYLSWELMTYKDTGARIMSVIVFNVPWLLMPIALMFRLYAVKDKHVTG